MGQVAVAITERAVRPASDMRVAADPRLENGSTVSTSMGRRRAREMTADLITALRDAEGVILQAPTDFQADADADLAAYFNLRSMWENGELRSLPSIDLGDAPVTVTKLASTGLLAGFVVRRAADGVTASRRIVFDAMRLSDRLASCLQLIQRTAPHWGAVASRLVGPTHLIVFALSEVNRALLTYLLLRPAPDVSQGRDAPDAWLDLIETAEYRRTCLRRVVAAHRAFVRLPARGPQRNAEEQEALSYADRILAHAGAGSTDGTREQLVELVRETDWLDEEEIQRARELIAGRTTTGARYLLAWSVLSVVEDGEMIGIEVFERALELPESTPRNRVATLFNLLQYATTWEGVQEAILRIVHEIRSVSGEEREVLQTQALPIALARIAAMAEENPTAATRVLRILAQVPDSFDFGRDHLWLVSGPPTVAVLEQYEEHTVEVFPLPGLDRAELLERLVLEHAEEFEDSFSIDGLRKDLTSAIEPLRTPLANRRGPVSVHPFGLMKHIPIASLTGREALLASRPGLFLHAPGRPTAAGGQIGRFWLFDESIAQSAKLPRDAADESFGFDSTTDDLDPDCHEAFLALRSTKMTQIVCFTHGHVDQFERFHVGIVINQSDEGPRIVPSIQIGQFDLSHVELAVVLACGAAQGSVFCEPSLDLGHAFRAAGVETVIAPQWPIVAEDALAFLRRFLDRVDGGDSYQHAWSEVLGEEPNKYMSVVLLAG
jgi:hypothetical protein